MNGTNGSATSREIKVEGPNLDQVVSTVSYWNNIIEIDVKGTPSYIVNGYISANNNNRNICISLGSEPKSFVEIKSQSKLDLNR